MALVRYKTSHSGPKNRKSRRSATSRGDPPTSARQPLGWGDTPHHLEATALNAPIEAANLPVRNASPFPNYTLPNLLRSLQTRALPSSSPSFENIQYRPFKLGSSRPIRRITSLGSPDLAPSAAPAPPVALALNMHNDVHAAPFEELHRAFADVL